MTQMVSLKEITSKIGSGATPRGGKESYKNQGIALIRSMNVYDFSFDYNDLAFIDEIQASQLANVEVEPEDILLNITGASVARCAIVPDSILPARVNQHVSIIRINKSKAVSNYVLYAINSPFYKKTLMSIAQGGATREALTKDKIENFEIPFPPLPVQRRIAGVLSAYDDLIENNTRRIKILEQMAQRIYKHWFVDFKFPGHEKTKFVNSPLGKIPEGWEVTEFGNIYETSSGGTPSRDKKEYFNGTIPWVKTKELNDSFIHDTEENISESGLKNSSAKMFPPKTVLIALYGATIGKLGILENEAATNQACCAVLQKSVGFDTLFSYFMLMERREDLINLRMGAAQQNISQIIIRNFPIVKPKVEVVKKFIESINCVMQQISNMQKQSAHLRRTRDFLLPKLINGEIEV